MRHGSYSYHNVLFVGKDLAVTNFDRAEIGIQVRDLYDFLRKAMEKNGWQAEFGKSLIDAYDRERKLEETERRMAQLLGRMSGVYCTRCCCIRRNIGNLSISTTTVENHGCRQRIWKSCSGSARRRRSVRTF